MFDVKLRYAEWGSVLQDYASDSKPFFFFPPSGEGSSWRYIQRYKQKFWIGHIFNRVKILLIYYVVYRR